MNPKKQPKKFRYSKLNQSNGIIGKPMIGYKKAYISHGRYRSCWSGDYELWYPDRVIIKLEIPKGAHVVAVGRPYKHRANRAKVLSITYLDGSPLSKKDKKKKVYAVHTRLNKRPFLYRNKQVIKIGNFDKSDKTCSTGIHFFRSRQKAVDY